MNLYSKYTFKERISYLILILGVFADQVSTRIGIQSLNLIESNPITSFLIQNGVWLFFDIVLIILILYISTYLIHSNEKKYFSFVYLYSLISGLIRIYASICNVNLILSLI
jgi:uncharacterized membrane protein